MVVVLSAKLKKCGGGASASNPLLRIMAVVTCLTLWLASNVHAESGIKLADLQGLSYSSTEFLARIDTLPDYTSRLALSNEIDARDALKIGLLNKHFAEQARRQGLDDLSLVKRALELLHEEVLIDWYVQYNVDYDLVRSAGKRIKAPKDESIAGGTDLGAVEYRLQQAFVARAEPSARALISSISSDLANNVSRRSFADVMQQYLEKDDAPAVPVRGRITSADFNMGWHELTDVESRFRPFVESSAAGDVFGPLRLESGWIFLSVMDKRSIREETEGQALKMSSMRGARAVRESIVSAIIEARLIDAGTATEAARPRSFLAAPSLTTPCEAALITVVREMGGLFRGLASLAPDASQLVESKESSLPDDMSSGLQDKSKRDRLKAWQQRRAQHHQIAQQARDALGEEWPEVLLARLAVVQDGLLSRLQVRALASTKAKQANVTDTDLERIYQQNIDRFEVPAQVKIRQIFLASSVYSDREVKAINEQVHRNPQTFGLTAMRIDPEESNIGVDGLGNPVALPELDPTIFKAILSLEIGEISEPVASSRGSHILVLDQFTPVLLKTRDDVKGSLISIFADELMLAEERRLMSDLKRKVVVY